MCCLISTLSSFLLTITSRHIKWICLQQEIHHETKKKVNGSHNVHPTGLPRSMYPSDPTEEERKRMSEEQMGLTCLDRDRDAYIR